ncbi:MAG: hypothetical protein GY862_27100 [Gammaproteobacteria bacterium]|nr:hypothetical protein [Gammaproteobacteria bacterium]MCP5013865.1 hypothetical protein [Ketobacter sp.]
MSTTARNALLHQLRQYVATFATSYGTSNAIRILIQELEAEIEEEGEQ